MLNNTQHSVLLALEMRKGAFVSGGALAAELGLSRNAVWKAVRSLTACGYDIESVTGKGYRLSDASSILSAESIERHLTCPGIDVEYHAEIDSTNTRCKALAEAGAAHGTLVVADCQTAGRGRQGRAFYSPSGSGVYFSLLLRPAFALADTTYITSFAAVALAEAIDAMCAVNAQIKWVNDVFVHGRKVSGILTEASFDAESQSVAYVVIGIGVNVFDPPGGFPQDMVASVGSICGTGKDVGDTRARIVAQAASYLTEHYEEVPERAHLAQYRARSILDGRRVTIQDRLLGDVEATVLGINDDFTLKVRLDDGCERDLVHGDVHIPSTQLASTA